MRTLRSSGFHAHWIVLLIPAVLISCAEDRIERQVTGLTAELEPVVDGNGAFAWDVYDQLRGEPGNIFLSPFSISAALSMAQVGAREQTAAQMSDVLHIKGDSHHHAFGELIQDLNGDKGRGYDLFIANRLFGRDDIELGEDFLTLLETEYDAGLEQLSFGSDPRGSTERINEWVYEHTQEKIVDFMPQGVVGPETVLVLANAIYFKALWATQFDPANTYDGTFERADGEEVTVPMMSSEIECSSLQSSDHVVLELDYEDHELSMIIIMPQGENTLDELEANLVSSGLDDLLEGTSRQESQIRMPRFEMRYKFSLNDTLQAMGMVDAFDASVADFSGITDGAFISDVLHEAYIRVDEEGTEAAAATGVAVALTSASLPIDIDRAFLFVIRDKLTGSLLFLGRVSDPSLGA